MGKLSDTMNRPGTMNIVTVREGGSRLVLSMPHSGVVLPDDLAADYRPEAIGLVDTDWHIPLLYDFAETLDATVVAARVSRYVIDLNRPRDGASLYPGQATTGLCPTTFFDGRPLYHDGCEPDDAETARRVEAYWDTYHAALTEQIDRAKSQHGRAVLYDCHSIASEVPRLFEGTLPVLNLGTARGTSCRPEVEAALAALMTASPHESVVNGRFVGGFITRNYGRPDAGVDAVQMEIGQDAYMDRRPTFAYRPDLAASLKTTLRQLLDALVTV